VRLLLWNIQYRRRGSPHGRMLREIIDSHVPDIICVTEGHGDFLERDHTITSEADYGYPIRPGRRKVLLWSRSPWKQVDAVGSDTLPSGRFVAGTTETSIGLVRFLGVCVPWADAHVTSGRCDRRKWEDHTAYLNGLADIVSHEEHGERTVMLGDYNHWIPRKREPTNVAEALKRALGDRLYLATSGIIPGVDHSSIDHVAHTSDLEAVRVHGLSNRSPDGAEMTDHIGIVVELQQRSANVGAVPESPMKPLH
jgi:hypothetical protein